MLTFFSAWIVWLSEIPIVYLFFSGVSSCKRLPLTCFSIGVLLMSLGTACNYLNSNNALLNEMLSLLIGILFGISCFRLTLGRAVFFSGVINLILVAAEMTVMSIGAGTMGIEADAYNRSFYVLAVQVSCCRILQILICILFRTIIHAGDERNRLPLNLILFPLSSFLCLAVLLYIGKDISFSPQRYRLLIIVAVSMFLATAVTVIIQIRYLEKEKEYHQLKTENTRLQTERAYYSILEEQNNSLMIYAHDAKKHLSAIRNLNTDPKITGYVDRLNEQLQSYAKSGHSGNKLLDVMLEKYAISCRQKGICFNYDVKLCNLEQLQDIDLVAILGNLMDNAVTAAEASRKKEILLSTAHRNSYDILIVSNSCDVPPVSHARTLFSSKENTLSHGYGIKSVKKALEKYSGDFDWEYDEASRTFIATAMIGAQ